MKKILVLFSLLFFSIAAYANRNTILFFLYSHYFERPKQLTFTSYSEGRIDVSYVKSDFLQPQIGQITKRIGHDLEEAEQRVGEKLNGRLTVYLYNTWEEKGNHMRDIRLAEADKESNTIYCILNRQYDGLKEGAQYQLLLRQRYGQPYEPQFLNYASAALSGIWNQKRLDSWAEFLLSRKLFPHFPLYLSNTESLSEFVLYPWNSIFFQFINETFGTRAMIELYRSGTPPKNYETAWQDYLSKISFPRIDPAPFQPEFQKGISYAYSNGYRTGYGTEKSSQSLDELKATGVNWVAAIPYGYMPSDRGTTLRFAGHNIFGESDESMIALLDSAHLRGLKVMMKPQIWVHRSWTGAVDFDTKADWNEFFSNYENWILHYAIISELHRADLLCIGTEFVQATLKDPARWRKMIARIREVYHGPLVYAANYGKEFEGIAFWDALDYLGLDNYYPVRNSRTDRMDSMKSAFLMQKEKLRSLALRYHKPLLFTEIGYMANNSAGMGTAEADDDSYNEQAQADCYRLALQTYWNEPWFAGMYWWKWFSDVSDRGRKADRHSPHGRAAELVLKEWYKRSHR